MDFLTLSIGICIGLCVGGFAVSAFLAKKTAIANESARHLERERDELKQHLEVIQSSEKEVVELQTRLEEQQKHASDLQKRMAETFAKISHDTVSENSKAFLELASTKFEPFKELLQKTQVAQQELETKRVKAYVELQEATKNILDVNQELRGETTKLETALRRPDHRGKWGEVGLRNVVEFAGMTEHCDFIEQVVTQGDQNLRPDMIVRVPGGGQIIVDSKLPLEHYLNASEDPENASGHLDNHAKMVEQHVKTLSGKGYWEQFEKAPNFVVLFVNVESALIAALERNPSIHPNALEKNVLITTPTTLLALLQAAAFGWRQESIAENAEEIAKAGQELFNRLSTFKSYIQDVGKRISQANESYNKAVGSFNTRLMPGAKKLSELQTTSGKELDHLEGIDIEPRPLQDS